MATIVAYQDDLKITWHPGCSYGNGYSVGAIGRRGPDTTEEDLNKEIRNTEIPSCLALHITIPGDVKHLYEVIFNELKINYTGIEVITNPPRELRMNGKIKEEYQLQHDAIVERNSQIGKKYAELVTQLEDLGCDTSDLSGPKLEKIPDSFYDFTMQNTDSFIEVRCHNATKFYEYLYSAGVLEKFYPQWYRDGKY